MKSALILPETAKTILNSNTYCYGFTTRKLPRKWRATRREYEAKAERLSAEDRLKHNKMFDNYGEEFDALGDWTEATWDEFAAKIDKNWQAFVLSVQSN